MDRVVQFYLGIAQRFDYQFSTRWGSKLWRICVSQDTLF